MNNVTDLTVGTKATREQINTLKGLHKNIRDVIKNSTDTDQALDEIREIIIASAECVGTCESCSEILLEGDEGYHFSENSVCDYCAPSWGELKESADEPDLEFGGFETLEDLANFKGRLASHIAGGGSLDDKVIMEL